MDALNAELHNEKAYVRLITCLSKMGMIDVALNCLASLRKSGIKISDVRCAHKEDELIKMQENV